MLTEKIHPKKPTTLENLFWPQKTYHPRETNLAKKNYHLRKELGQKNLLSSEFCWGGRFFQAVGFFWAVGFST